MPLATLIEAIEHPTPQGIASALSMLIRSGDLPPGTRLPTVRDIARELSVSPATVSGAWKGLVQAGLIQARGRAGTFVLEPRTPWLTPRSRGLADRTALSTAGALRLDLATGLPDPLLLPDIAASLERIAPRRASVTSYTQPPLLPELEAPLRERWPYEAPALTMVDGAMDGVERALRAVARYGDRVVVENPTFPLLLDLLDHLHLMAVPARIDHRGMVPDALDAALRSRPAAVVLQPRAHNPTGAALSASRAEELASVLSRHRYGRDAVIIEDDHTNLVSGAPAVSLGTWLPGRTLHVGGFSKSHGPDLRIAAMSGPPGAIDRIVGYRVLGSGWTSRILQAVLLDLLTTRPAVAAISVARYEYFTRQRELASRLRAQGLEVEARDGLNVWVPVADEAAARVTLAAAGILVSPGSAFVVPSGDDGGESGPHRGDHVRVSLGALREQIPEAAAAIALAAVAEA